MLETLFYEYLHFIIIKMFAYTISITSYNSIHIDNTILTFHFQSYDWLVHGFFSNLFSIHIIFH